MVIKRYFRPFLIKVSCTFAVYLMMQSRAQNGKFQKSVCKLRSFDDDECSQTLHLDITVVNRIITGDPPVDVTQGKLPDKRTKEKKKKTEMSHDVR